MPEPVRDFLVEWIAGPLAGMFVTWLISRLRTVGQSLARGYERFNALDTRVTANSERLARIEGALAVAGGVSSGPTQQPRDNAQGADRLAGGATQTSAVADGRPEDQPA